MQVPPGFPFLRIRQAPHAHLKVRYKDHCQGFLPNHAVHSHRAYLEGLAPQLSLDVEGCSVLLVHGSPRKNNEDILPDTPIEEVEKMLVNVGADVVLCGHTHLPCGFQTSKKKTVVNAGSIGRPFTPEPKSCYLTIIVNNGECLFEHHFVEYDKERASAKLRKREFEGADKLANMLLNPKVRHF
ncbi:hypothetical protein EGQ24_00575 [bacterium]|nr:hypothetical protein [bacterium]